MTVGRTLACGLALVLILGGIAVVWVYQLTEQATDRCAARGMNYVTLGTTANAWACADPQTGALYRPLKVP